MRPGAGLYAAVGVGVVVAVGLLNEFVGDTAAAGECASGEGDGAPAADEGGAACPAGDSRPDGGGVASTDGVQEPPVSLRGERFNT
ncbi:MAG TPA: hypothetical protein VFY90_02515, partial [Tepidiformaceae bacterium]|nr:hypothetical protein [Tepidiformaceae bacterium]